MKSPHFLLSATVASILLILNTEVGDNRVQAFTPIQVRRQQTISLITVERSVGKVSMEINDEKRSGNYRDPGENGQVTTSDFEKQSISLQRYFTCWYPKNTEIRVSWEPEAARIIREMAMERDSKDRPFLIGVVGIPGSGKSTSCGILENLLPNCLVMPMDGYHYSLETLNQMDNPDDLVYRRGAPDTFNPQALTNDLYRILEGTEPSVSIPGFDHAVGDPTPDEHTFVRGQHQIVICEGIYLLHDHDGWEKVKDMLDYSIYIEADIDTCVERLKERNKCIPGYTEEEIEIRCEVVDRRNAETALHSQQYADLSVKSGAVGIVSECDTAESENA
jgi:pantothenate kinase